MNHQENLDLLIAELGLEPKEYLHRGINSGFFIIYGRIKRRDVLVKVVPLFQIRRVGNTYKEAMADGIIESHNQDLSKPLILRTKVLGVGQNENFAWIIRRYYNGLSLANPMKDKEKMIVNRLSLIQPKYLRQRDIILGQVNDNLEALKSLEKDFRRLKVRKEFFEKRFHVEFEPEEIQELGGMLGVDLMNSYRVYRGEKDQYYNKINLAASNCDLTPANIIIKTTGEVVFSDFEWFCFDNYQLDNAFFWLFLWRHPSWQAKFKALTVKNKKDEQHFKLSIFRIIASWYLKCLKGKDSKVFIEEYKNHIWTKYLKEPLEQI